MTGVHASHKWYLIGPLSLSNKCIDAKGGLSRLLSLSDRFVQAPDIYILIGECFDLGVCFALAICIGGFLVSPTQL